MTAYRRALWLMGVALLTSQGTARAQGIADWSKEIVEIFEQPVYPIIGGVASGGGIGGGVGFRTPASDPWFAEAQIVGTYRRYWSVQGEAGRTLPSHQTRLAAFGGVRHMNRVDFFGLGPHTTFDQRTNFRLREAVAGVRGSVQPHPRIRAGLSVAVYMPDTGRGANPNVPSIEQLYSEDDAPGLSEETTFGRYRGFVEVSRFGTYQLAFETSRDFGDRHHSFHRWEFGTRHELPGLRDDQRLTLHGLVAATGGNEDIPFYMLYTLGGSGGLKAFRPDLLGTDGTRATLRGFRNYRFRDRDLVLMQAEYRVPILPNVHATLFVDSGQVAPRVSELMHDLRTTTGFSLGYVRGDKTFGRMDVGFGGGEGVHVFWSFDAF